MKTVGAFEGKTHFSALIEAAAHGETTIVTRKGVPVAKIAPLDVTPAEDPHDVFDRILARRIRIGIPVRELIDEGRN